MRTIKKVGIEDIKVGDKLVWKPDWNGHRFHPGPLNVTQKRLESKNVEVAEGVPANCQYDFDSFFCYGYGTYECPACGHVGYVRTQQKEAAICGKCYKPTNWVGLTAKP
jgi:hypothetical protein